jgi:Protein of unknown function (DUF1588)/Protein of unknown function (DUF1592)/Protein of unknown function (DUF1585)
MKTHPSFGFASGLAAVLAVASACGGNRALSPSTPDAGSSPSTGGAGGLGGTGVDSSGVGGDRGLGGAPGSPIRIPGVEALTRFAAVLWDQAPDDALAHSASHILTSTELEGVVRALLLDPRASVGVGAFYRWWLELDEVATLKKDPTLFAEFTPALQADMANETAAFGVDVTLAMNGTFQTLMTAGFSSINERLAKIYGVSGVTGDDLRRVTLPVGQRAGLLTQPALQALGSLTTRNSPTHRGAYIDRTFFCQAIPAAPLNVPSIGPSPPPGMTMRQALASVVAAADCGACHKVFDPPGLAFEGFDPIGRARATDNGRPVDTSNLKIVLPRPNTNGPTTVVSGPLELADLLANDVAVQDCFARKWMAFALGRELGGQDEPSVMEIDARFAASGFDLRELVVAVLVSDSFLRP